MKKTFCILLAGFAMSAQALAAPVSYVFEASFSEVVVDNVDPPPGSFVEQARIFSSISGVLTYDPDVDADFEILGYAVFESGVSLKIDQFDLGVVGDDGSATLIDGENFPFITNPRDSISFSFGVPVEANFLEPFFFEGFSLFFADNTKTALSDLSLPDEIILTDFDSAVVTFIYNKLVADAESVETIGSAVVEFNIDRFERVAEVPLPAALPLFLVGAAGLGALLRRKKRPAFEDA